jgi:uncharacterized protein (TIGR02147 family)
MPYLVFASCGKQRLFFICLHSWFFIYIYNKETYGVKPMHTKPDIWTFTDYRMYLKQRMQWEKLEHQLSLRALSQKAGIKSSGSLSRVISGQKNLGSSLARRLAQALHLAENESDYFMAMVEFNQAKSFETRILYYKQMMKLIPPQSVAHDNTLFKLYSKWYFPAILELLHFAPFTGNYKQLAQRLNPPILESEAKLALHTLMELNLVIKTAKGIIRIPQKILSTGHHVQSLAVEAFQMEMIDLSERAIQDIAREERNISTLTFSAAQKDFARIEEEIRKFRKKILSLVNSSSQEDTVYQINVQCFPLTHTPNNTKLKE